MHAASGGGFFDVERPEPPPEPEFPPQPAWLQPPDDELPGRVILDEMMYRDDATVVLLREVRSYRAGLGIAVRWMHRRRNESAQDWERFVMEAHRWFPGRFPEPDGLHVGVRTGDGAKLLPIDHQWVQGPASELRPPTLQVLGGGGGGGVDRYDHSLNLWLWNGAPVREPVEVVTSWPALGVPETGYAIGADVLAAAPAPRPLWD